MKIQNLDCKYGKSTLLKDLIFSGIILVILCFFAFTFEIWLSICRVEQSSMIPTLYPNDIVVDKLSNYETKDIIVFKHSNGALLIKRVIAFEGETVYVKDGKVRVKRIVNGQVNEVELVEPYLNGQLTTGIDQEITLGKGELFVLGDNRVISNDSRDFGPIKKEQVIGVVKKEYIGYKQFFTKLLG